MSKIPLIVVVGPTASGKTALAIDIANYGGGEIVSADSMQIYKYMDIGSDCGRNESSRSSSYRFS